MGLEFIDRTLRTTGIVLLIFLPFGVYYLGVWPALAVFSGGVWGMVNLIFISALVRAAIRPERVDKRKVLGIAIFKFPLLYLSGYALARVPQFDPLFLLYGFSSLMLIIILKAIGGSIWRVSDHPVEGENARGIA
ncbi:MAG: hypothetical protein NTW07_03895 [candidate division Zixibacteria bacterium]|nr:hypothetical protein [candidate division Zixibacteria bacterium]